MKCRKLIIAIDGPAGAGKSTVGKLVAHRLGYDYLDTGAMYRAVTLKALRLNVPLDDETALTELAHSCNIQLQSLPSCETRVFLDGEDVSEHIRTPEVSRAVSIVSAVSGVRRALQAKQRAMGRSGGIVAEGRDIQTVVFPDADLKIFLTATVEERARRRWVELRTKGYDVHLDEVLSDTMRRDEIDSLRYDSPLAKAPDAIEIDTTNMSIEEVVECITQLATQHALDLSTQL